LEHGLNINPTKTELILFTNKTKITTLELPKFDGIAINLTQCVWSDFYSKLELETQYGKKRKEN
jgi:hypothetical protein